MAHQEMGFLSEFFQFLGREERRTALVYFLKCNCQLHAAVQPWVPVLALTVHAQAGRPVLPNQTDNVWKGFFTTSESLPAHLASTCKDLASSRRSS